MGATDSEPLESACRLVEAFADRLPQGEREDDVRRSLTGALIALREQHGVEGAVRQLIGALHQLDEATAVGKRREFQHNAPAIGRLLESLQEDLLPLLRRAGYHV